MSAGGFGKDYPDVPVPHPDDPPPSPEELQHSGQVRMAYALERLYKGRLLHVHEVGWYYWAGTHWAPDKTGKASKTVQAVLRTTLGESLGDKALSRDVHKCNSQPAIEGILKVAATLEGFAFTTEDIDQDPYLLNTQNGTLDLRTGELLPHNPGHRITKVAGAEYDPTATGVEFERFLSEILPDPETRAHVQTLFGLAAVGKPLEHVLPIFTGTGKNGKSTLLNAARAAFGDYGIEAEPDLLIERHHAHPTGLMDLRGVRLAVCQESDEGRRLAVGTVKRLTGGDRIRARAMRKDFVEFAPSHTAVLVTNHKPRVPGDDPALWRRLQVIPFDVVVSDPDPKLPERLDLERAAVLAWVVAGWKNYQDNGGLRPPASVTAATEAYQEFSDVLGRFLDECTEKGHPEAVYVRSGELFSRWQAWCSSNGENPGRQNEFTHAIEARGYSKVKRSIGAVFKGLTLQLTDGSDGYDAFSH